MFATALGSAWQCGACGPAVLGTPAGGLADGPQLAAHRPTSQQARPQLPAARAVRAIDPCTPCAPFMPPLPGSVQRARAHCRVLPSQERQTCRVAPEQLAASAGAQQPASMAAGRYGAAQKAWTCNWCGWLCRPGTRGSSRMPLIVAAALSILASAGAQQPASMAAGRYGAAQKAWTCNWCGWLCRPGTR